ncbi:tyrosine-type recombinase/integrase [Phreatobacter sp.]|uniref:tyrosine-type recombinase/integrase n=1 Tax=Phreatobacter sp. TaxID=1966341 RepID=UPI0025DF5078|nr:tyrosine-type recombinase/integrase [Phreatobacter sp.]
MERETSSEQVRHAWNSGRLVGPKPPLKPKDIWAIRAQLRHQHRIRDLALFNLAIDSKLRGCDLVHLRVTDVVLAGNVRPRASVMQSKTGRPVVFELTDASRESVLGWLRLRPHRNGDWLFPSRNRSGQPMTTRQYARLLNDWLGLAGLDHSLYGTHSLRRTKVALIYKRTGNLRACQLLLGHTKLETTVRYLGVELDDALELSEQVDL